MQCSTCSYFISSRRRHTSCALVTGVQTCALPIFTDQDARALAYLAGRIRADVGASHWGAAGIEAVIAKLVGRELAPTVERRSEERRVGKECVSTCSTRWSPYHYKNKHLK